MVHGRAHRLDCLGVSEGQNRNLYALQELFHNNVVAAGAECLVLHNGLDRVLGFGKVLGDDDTLAQSQTVRLDDNGVFVHLLDVGNCRMGIVKGLIAGSGNAVLLHQVLGKDLAALEDCRIGTGTKGGDTSLVERIHHAQYQRVIRRNHNKVDAVTPVSYTHLDVYKRQVLDLQEAALLYSGEKLSLSKNEFLILRILFEHKNSPVSREELIRALWNDESFIDDNTLTVNIARIRKKLEETGLRDFIRTRKGLGYLIEEKEHD